MAGPLTYTYSQFHQHTGGDAQAYNKYLRYVANFRANKIAHLQENPVNANALEPIAPSTEIPVLHKMAASEINPLLGAENRAYQSNVDTANNAITGYTKNLAAFYQPQSQQMMDNLKTATGAMAATNGALGSTLSAGPAGMGDLSKYLTLGGNSTAPIANLPTTGANLLAARGAAAINGMTGAQTAGANAAAFLPTVAASTGQQELTNTLDAYTAAHNKSTAALLAQEPGIFSKLYQQYMNEEIQKAIARNSGMVAQTNATSRAASAAASQTRAAAGTYYYKNPVTGKQQLIPAGDIINAQGQVVKASSTPASGPGSTRYKAYQTAVGKATTSAKQIALAAVKPVATTKTVPGLLPGTTTTQKANARIANYYGTLHKIVATVTPILSPYMGPNDITRWVQKFLQGYYQPGQYGMPGTGKPQRGK